MKKSSSSEKAMTVRKSSPLKKNLIVNNPVFFEPLKLLNYNVDNLNITEEIKNSAEYVLG